MAAIAKVSESAKSERLDKVGASASALCALHCALMPFVLSVLPILGLGFLADERAEWGLLLLSVILATSSLCVGYRSHRSRRPLAIASVGVTMLLIARLTHHQHHAWDGDVRDLFPGAFCAVIGGLSIAGAHWINRGLCRSCHACAHHRGENNGHGDDVAA